MWKYQVYLINKPTIDDKQNQQTKQNVDLNYYAVRTMNSRTSASDENQASCSMTM